MDFNFICNHVQVQVFLQRGEELTILLEVSAAACALLWNKMNFMSFCTVKCRKKFPVIRGHHHQLLV